MTVVCDVVNKTDAPESMCLSAVFSMQRCSYYRNEIVDLKAVTGGDTLWVDGRGAGFHQFSGLSTPVLIWFNALYKPYTVTSGFLTTISCKKQEQNQFFFRVNSTAEAPVVLVCLEENSQYAFHTTGIVENCNKGTYCIRFPGPILEDVRIICCGLS